MSAEEEAGTVGILRAWDRAPDGVGGEMMHSRMLAALTDILEREGLAAHGCLTQKALDLCERVNERTKKAREKRVKKSDGEAPAVLPEPAPSSPLAQALDLLRRTRAVLHKLDPAHEKLRGEIDALLAGAPVVETEEADASRPGLTEEEARSLAEHVGIKLGLAKDDREEPVTTATRAILGWFASRGDIPPDVRPPHTHPLTEEDARRWERLRVVASAIRDREYEGDFRVSDETAMLFDELRHAIAAVENTQTATPQRAPLTEEEARIARGLHACAGAWEPDVRLIGNLTAREIERFASAILSRGDIPPDVRAVAASSAAGEWQCVSCHAREREMHREWCEIEGAAGTVASRATDVRPVAPFTEEEARRSLGAALREAAKQNAIYSPMCAVRAGADVGRVAPKVEEPMLTPAEEADVIAGAPAQIAPHGQSEIEILRAAVVRAHERIDALEKKPVEATIAAMAAQIERLDAEMRHVLVTIARRPKVEGDDVEAEEDPRTRLHEGDPEGKPSTLKERVSRVVLGTIDGEPVHVRATAKDKP